MIIEITGDEELKRLLGIDCGFFLNVDYPTKLVTVHMLNCRLCDPENDEGIKPSRKKGNKSGEFWFSNRQTQIISKVKEFREKGYSINLCTICNSDEIVEQ